MHHFERAVEYTKVSMIFHQQRFSTVPCADRFTIDFTVYGCSQICLGSYAHIAKALNAVKLERMFAQPCKCYLDDISQL